MEKKTIPSWVRQKKKRNEIPLGLSPSTSFSSFSPGPGSSSSASDVCKNLWHFRGNGNGRNGNVSLCKEHKKRTSASVACESCVPMMISGTFSPVVVVTTSCRTWKMSFSPFSRNSFIFQNTWLIYVQNLRRWSRKWGWRRKCPARGAIQWSCLETLQYLAGGGGLLRVCGVCVLVLHLFWRFYGLFLHINHSGRSLHRHLHKLKNWNLCHSESVVLSDFRQGCSFVRPQRGFRVLNTVRILVS